MLSAPRSSLRDDLSRFCCQHPACPDYGLRGQANRRTCFRYGPHRRRLRACRTGQGRFAERKGTALLAPRLPHAKALAVRWHLSDGCGVRQTARLVGVAKDTVVGYAVPAGTHARQTHDELVAFSPGDPGSPIR